MYNTPYNKVLIKSKKEAMTIHLYLLHLVFFKTSLLNINSTFNFDLSFNSSGLFEFITTCFVLYLKYLNNYIVIQKLFNKNKYNKWDV